MTWSFHIRSAFIAFAAVAGLAASEAELSLQDRPGSQNPFDNVGFFYPMLDKKKLVGLLINDGMILPPPTLPDCRQDDGPLGHAPQLVSGSTYQCQDWLLVNGGQAPEEVHLVSDALTYTPSRSIERREHVQSGAAAVGLGRGEASRAGQRQGISFVAATTDKLFEVGLDDLNNQHDHSGIPAFSVACDESGTLSFKEEGQAKSTADVHAGDTIEIAINGEGSVDFFLNGETRLTSHRSDVGELNVVVNLQDGAEIKDPVWVLHPDQAVIAPCSPVNLHGLTNAVSTEGRIQKSSGQDGTWDAGAASHPFNIAGSSGVRGFSFQPSQNDASMMAGFGETGGDPTFAAVLSPQGVFRVTEAGDDRGTYGTYGAGSIVEVVVNHANEVEYRVDGEIRYVSALQVPASLRVLVRFKDTGAALEGATWAPGPAAHASIKAVGAGVDFKFQRGLSTHVGTGQLEGLNGVSGRALSVHSVSGLDHITGFTFQPMQADKGVTFGLTSDMGSEGRGPPPFSIKCNKDGSLITIEDGVERPLGNYAAGDLMEMSLNDVGNVEVKVNSESKFTSSRKPALPLAVEAFLDANAGAYNVKWAGMESCLLPESLGHPIGFDGFAGVTQLDRGHFKKVLIDGWDSASATSLKHFTEEDSVSGVSFQIASNEKKLMVGLSNEPLRQGHIADYAVVCQHNGAFDIYEGHEHIGQFGKFIKNDEVSVIVNAHGLVEFSVNKLVRYTSKTPPSYPLNVVSSLHDRSAEIYNVKWARASDSRVVASLIADTPARFQEVHGAVKIDGGRLRKLATLDDGWNAGAVAVDGLQRDDRANGVSFIPRFADRWVMVGLSRSGTMMGWDNSDFAAHCKADGTFVILESGAYVGEYGHYAAGDKIEVVVNEQDHVEYKVQGQIRYVSKATAVLPLSVKTFFHHARAEAKIPWSGCIEHLPYEGLLELSDPVDFCQRAVHSAQDDLVQFTLWDGLVSPGGFQKGGLQKMDDMAPGHYGTAVSVDEIADSSDIAGFSFQPLQDDSFVMMGLTLASHLEQRVNEGDLDFAVVLNRGGELDVYESGELLGSFGQYHSYDAIEIRLRSDDIAEVFVNGHQLPGASSAGSMSFPLRAVALIKDPEAVIYNIRWVGQGVHQFAIADGAPIEFVGGGINAVALLEKQRMRGVSGMQTINGLQGLGGGVESRAVSTHAIVENGQVQGIKFQLPDPSSDTILVGLHADEETQDLDYALKIEAGRLDIYEKGVRKETLGSYTKSDTLSIVVTSASKVEYRVGCQNSVEHEFNVNIALPLHAHMFLSESSEIANFVWISQSQCPSELAVGEPMMFDQFNGLGQVGAGSVRKLASSGMDWRSDVLSTNAIYDQADTATVSAEGFVFQAPSFDTQAFVGFTKTFCVVQDGPLCHAKEERTIHDLDHAIFFSSSGGVSVWEKGSLIGDFGTYEAGDSVSLTINRGGEMVYTVNDQVRYTSIQRPSYPIKMSAFIMNPGGQLDGLEWTRELDTPASGTPAPESPESPVAFHRFRGGAVAPSNTKGELQKLSTAAAAWNAGAVSEGFIMDQSVDTKGVSFRPKTADEHHLAHLMVGLSTGVISGGNNNGVSPSVNYKAIDFGALLLRTGEFQVFVKGEFKGSFGHYKADDVIKILYNHPTVEYWVNDEENARYISDAIVEFPLFVDVALYDPEAQVYDVKWA